MTAASLRVSARRVLESWRPIAPGDDWVRTAILAFVDATDDACLRHSRPGHITASAVVFSDDNSRVLLTHHPRVGRWIQLGGHCEPDDDTVVDAALREATEESGIVGLRIAPHLFGAAAYPITCSLGLPTRHLDLFFRLQAPHGARPSAGSQAVQWWPVDALPAGVDFPLHQR